MITSRPKTSTLFSVGLVIIMILGVDSWILAGLISNPGEYFVAKLILTPSLLVIAIIIANKSIFSSLQLSLGDNKLIHKYLLRRKHQTPLSGIDYWSEEVVKRRKTEFRQVTIVLKSRKKLQLSNHENTDYPQVVNYLNKKAKKIKR